MRNGLSERTIQIEKCGLVAWIWLNRPEVHNAFDASLIAELTAAFALLANAPSVLSPATFKAPSVFAFAELSATPVLAPLAPNPFATEFAT